MSVDTSVNSSIRELAIRQNSGTTVALFWNSETEEIFLTVENSSESFEVREIPHPSALDAWNHPYAYADHMLKSGRSRVISNA